MKIRCLIKRRNQKASLYNVYVALYEGDTTELISTRERITLSEWSGSDSLPKNHNSKAFQAFEKVKGGVQKAIKRLEADEKPVTPFTVKQEFLTRQETTGSSQRESDRNAKKDLITVSKLADRWTENELFRFRTSTQKSVKESINAFKEYLKISGLANLERKNLTLQVISGYERYLLEKKKLSDNTHGKRLKQLRWFLKTLDFDIHNIKIRSSKKTIVSLTLAELGKLEVVDVSFSKEYQKAKDLFLLGCYTGLRISDLRRLNHTNTQNGFITLLLLKNNREVKIPIISEADSILARYEYRAPKLSEQALNECIKEVCKKALITDRVTVETTTAGKRVTKTKPKHEIITSHIAGKTFITLAPEKWGLTPAEIAGIVGKDLKNSFEFIL